MRAGVIIQARMGSTRLPGKVLLPLPRNTQTSVLEHVVCRAQQISDIEQIIVATSSAPEDNIIVQEVQKLNVTVFRGKSDNVLSRYYYAAETGGFDYIVRLTADNPLVDPEIASNLLKTCIKGQADYVCFDETRVALPCGVSSEVFSRRALAYAFASAKQAAELEHVTPVIQAWSQQQNSIIRLPVPTALQFSELRLTLDTPADYTVLSAIFDLEPRVQTFSTEQVINLFRQYTWLQEIHAHVQQRQLYPSVKAELQAAVAWLENQQMYHAVECLKQALKLHAGS